MAVSAVFKSRCRRASYFNRIAKAEDLIDLFPHNSYIGWSGFTGVGYPKSGSEAPRPGAEPERVG